MEVPRGHAMSPLNDSDFLDFVINYFKAEYSPIRSFWSTATAIPRNSERWVGMGHELAPLSFRPANAQAQKDLESLDYFIRTKGLDPVFVRGLVIRYAKYESHDRLEKKLYESCRLDLMIRKALKEKHLINSLWPSPAPRSIHPELLQQGVRVRQWYGDMFNKYFRSLRSVERFELRPDVEAKIKSSGTLMLVPFVDHLVLGDVDPIIPLVKKGAGYSNAAAWEQKDKGQSYGEPDRFEIRFDAPADIADTYTRSVVRTCKCLKCETTRDVTVVISVDPNPGPVSHSTAKSSRNSSNPKAPAPRRQASRAAQRYTPGYVVPGSEDAGPQQSAPNLGAVPDAVASPPVQKKQCPRCTFLNHPDLTACEMCAAELSNLTLVSKPPSPVLPASKPTHSHSKSMPPPTAAKTPKKPEQTDSRPAMSNRHSLSSSLFSIFPFNQQHQPEHEPHLPPTQPAPQVVSPPAMTEIRHRQPVPESKKHTPSHPNAKSKHALPIQSKSIPPTTERSKKPSTPPPNLIDDASPPPGHHSHPKPQPLAPTELEPPTTPLSQAPESAMMALTPPPTSDTPVRPVPSGLPQNLMDDFVPISAPLAREEEDAGWGEMSREEARRGDSSDDEDEDEDGEGIGGLIDLDEVARMEMGVWGEREEDEN